MQHHFLYRSSFAEGDPPRQRKLTLEQTASCLDSGEETKGRLTKRRVQRTLQLHLR